MTIRPNAHTSSDEVLGLRWLRHLPLLSLLLPLLLPSPTEAAPLPVASLERETPVNFATEIYPFLRANCLACHNSTKARAGLVLESPKDMLLGGDSGPSVVPGKAEDSFLFTTAAHIEEPEMPPANNKSRAENLTPEQLALLARWIDEGAQGDAVSTAAPQQWTRLSGPQPLISAAVSHEGRFAAAGRGQEIHLYDLRLGRRVASLEDPGLDHPAAHNDLVHALAFSPDGRLASGGYRVAKIWERSPAAPRDAALDLPAATAALAVSPDGALAAFGTPDGAIRLINPTGAGDAPVEILDHTGAVAALAFSPDGTTLYSASADGTLKRRPLADPSAAATLALPAPPTALVLVEGGRRLVLGSEDGALRVVPADFGTEKAEAEAHDPSPASEGDSEAPNSSEPSEPSDDFAKYRPHPGALVALALAEPGSASFLAGYADGTVLHLALDPADPDAAPLRELSRFEHGAPLARLAVSWDSPDGPRAATAGDSGPVRLWDLAEGTLLAELAGEPALAPRLEALRAAAAVAQRQQAHWDREAPEAGQLSEAESAKAKEGGETVATARRELAAKREALRELEGRPPGEPEGEADGEEGEDTLAKAREDLLAAERSLAGEIRNRELSARLAGESYGRRVAAEAASLEAAQLAAALTAEAEALEKAATEAAEAATSNAAAALAFADGGELLVQALPEGGARLWAAKDGAWLEDMPVGPGVSDLASAGPGALFLVAGNDGKNEKEGEAAAGRLVVWDLPGREWTLARALGDGASPEPFVDRVTALAFDPEGALLATGSGVPSRSGRVALWRSSDWSLAAENEEAHGDTVTGFAFSPDGTRLASASTDRLATVFETATLEPLHSFEGHTGHVLGVAWNADGLTVATAGGDHQVKLWNPGGGQQRQGTAAHEKEVGAIAYLGASESLLTASGDGSVKLANQPLPESGGAFYHTAAASADGKVVVAGGKDGVLRVWDAASRSLRAAFGPEETGHFAELGTGVE